MYKFLRKMNGFLLVICTVIAVSRAGPFSANKETKLEHVLNDLEVVLQDLQEQSLPEREMKSEDDKLKIRAGDLIKPGSVNKQPIATSQDKHQDILLYTTDVEAATAQIKAAGGRVTIQLGHDLLIARFPGDVALAQANFASASAHIPSSASEATINNAEAYWKMRGDKLKPQPKVQRWTEKTPPQAIPQPSGHSIYGADSPYRPTLSKKIAVAVVMVSGPGDLDLSDAETSTINSEHIAGLEFWTDNAPASADLSFARYAGEVPITAANPTSCSSHKACDDVFVNKVLEYFGYASREAMAKYYKDLANADGAFIAFISKYRQYHFAYATLGSGPIYMQYSNDGWGPDQIDRVFAHEVGHVFNAPDEYTSCSCRATYGKGTCTDTNDNCYNSKPSTTSCTTSAAQLDCIMDNNDMSNICDHSKKHVGWC